MNKLILIILLSLSIPASMVEKCTVEGVSFGINLVIPKILCLGDSITHGDGTTDYSGYRIPLQDFLGKGKYLFAGSFTDGADPSYQRNHAGVGGERTDQIKARLDAELDTWMVAPNPAKSKVILHAGTNDCVQEVLQATSIGYITDMLDMIIAHDATIAVYVAQIIPVKSAGDLYNRIVAFNTALETAVNDWKTANPTAKCYLVDQWTVFTDNTSYATEWMDNEWHPNVAGYTVMSETFYNSIMANEGA